MRLINKLERKFHWIAIPGLIRIVALLQGLVFLLYLARPEFLTMLDLNAAKIRDGEVWRLISFVFIPNTRGIIWIAFAIMVLIIMGDLLEGEMGAFRLTLFFASTVVLLIVGFWNLGGGAIYIPSESGVRQPGRVQPGMSFMASMILNSAIGILFGIKCPRFQFMLFGIIPVRAWVLGLISFLYLLWSFVYVPPLRLPIACGLLPTLLIGLPLAFEWFVLRERVWKARSRFQSNSLPASDHFSKCKVCGRTDATNPELSFRIAGDEEEYCEDHLPRK
jgi:hypothetical protein